MADANIADGVPMSLEQMREQLREHYGAPIALREQGANTVQCPYCHGKHRATETGHQETGCEVDFGSGICRSKLEKQPGLKDLESKLKLPDNTPEEWRNYFKSD